MSAARAINFGALTEKLSAETLVPLAAFRRKHADLTKSLKDLTESEAKPIDFAYYAKAIKNPSVVKNAEQAMKAFTPSNIDLKALNASIQSERTKAVLTANATVSSIASELASLKDLLVHIDTSRPLEDLTIEDAMQAVPALDKDVEKMVMRGQWAMVQYYLNDSFQPGYTENFGSWKVGF